MPFHAALRCDDVAPVPHRRTAREVFKLAEVFDLAATFTDAFSALVGDAYLGRDLRSHCSDKCSSVMVVRPVEWFAVTEGDYKTLPTEAEVAARKDTLDDAIRPIVPPWIESQSMLMETWTTMKKQ